MQFDAETAGAALYAKTTGQKRGRREDESMSLEREPARRKSTDRDIGRRLLHGHCVIRRDPITAQQNAQLRRRAGIDADLQMDCKIAAGGLLRERNL